MSVQLRGILAALLLGMGGSTMAAAQTRLTIAVMPTQYFSATQQSADNVTQALVQQYARQGYTVISRDRSRATFRAMGLNRETDFGDPTIARFGHRLGADLVAHPQLLASAVPADRSGAMGRMFPPSAVLYLRVVNARSGKGIYTRQVSYGVPDARPVAGMYALPPTAATAAVNQLTSHYFERVAGSRQEYGRMRGESS
jgi:hypothetical protein